MNIEIKTKLLAQIDKSTNNIMDLKRLILKDLAINDDTYQIESNEAVNALDEANDALDALKRLREVVKNGVEK